jgi:hypothetical protein
MPRPLEFTNGDDIIRRYKSGVSLNQLAHELGVSRGGFNPSKGVWFGLAGFMVRNGVNPRSQSESEKVKWDAMPTGKRDRQVESAHTARRGQKDSLEVRHKRSVAWQGTLQLVGEGEISIRDALIAAGYDAVAQFAHKGRNIDIAIESLGVAIEIQGHWGDGNGPGNFRKRTEELLGSGWAVMFAVGKPVDARHVAENAVAFAKAVGRNKALLGQYWVVGSHPDRCPRSSKHLVGLPRIPSLEPAAESA